MNRMDGMPLDFFNGSFEFETEFRREGDLHVATALGYEARHRDPSQALNDLNAKIDEAITKGELVPDQG